MKIEYLTINQKKFFAELIGTFVIVTIASGSVVLDAKYVGTFGLWFVALCPAVAVALMVYIFRKISMAHFNPAVTFGYLITRYLPRNLVILYFLAEAIGGFLASIFVRFIIGTQANLGANSPNYSYPIPLVFGIEVLATALLMGVILMVAHTKGLKGFSGVAIGGIIGLDIFFLSFISGASMNPIRSLAPAILSGYLTDVWLYLTATFVGSGIVALIYRQIQK